MSVTPVDDSQPAERESEAPERRWTSRVLSRVKGALAALGRALSPRREASNGSLTALSDGGRAAGAEQAPACPDIAGLPSRERPLTVPGRDIDGANTPDVVGIETETGLRISLPDHPEATLTSDTWVPVEP